MSCPLRRRGARRAKGSRPERVAGAECPLLACPWYSAPLQRRRWQPLSEVSTVPFPYFWPWRPAVAEAEEAGATTAPRRRSTRSRPSWTATARSPPPVWISAVPVIAPPRSRRAPACASRRSQPPTTPSRVGTPAPVPGARTRNVPSTWWTIRPSRQLLSGSFSPWMWRSAVREPWPVTTEPSIAGRAAPPSGRKAPQPP